MKTIGVLGGIGPQATMDFEARLHREAQRCLPQRSNAGYPPLLVYYFRDVPVVLPPDGTLPTTPPPVQPQLLEAARRLGAWADFLVLTSNGVHAYQQEIEQAAGRPVVSMVAATLAEVRRRNLRHVGLVDFRPAALGVYNQPLTQLGIRCETLGPALMAALRLAVDAVDEGKDGASVGAPAREALRQLRAQGVDGIIPACTEIPLMLPEAADDPDLINPAQCLAVAAIAAAVTGAIPA